jgi:hypothetical protein
MVIRKTRKKQEGGATVIGQAQSLALVDALQAQAQAQGLTVYQARALAYAQVDALQTQRLTLTLPRGLTLPQAQSLILSQAQSLILSQAQVQGLTLTQSQSLALAQALVDAPQAQARSQAQVDALRAQARAQAQVDAIRAQSRSRAQARSQPQPQPQTRAERLTAQERAQVQVDALQVQFQGLTLANYCEVNVGEQAEQAMLLNSTKIKSLEDYVLIWKGKPDINPYTNKKIIVSLYPYGEYVCLYKHFLEGLVRNILKSRTNKVLSVEECHRIKNSLPNEHARVIFDNKEISYDYLFIKYFIMSKTIKYDHAFRNELTIYLDLSVYNTSKYKKYKDEEILDSSKRDQSEFLPMLRKNYTIKYFYIELFLNEYLKSRFIIHSFGSLVLKICIDIEQFKNYMIVETKQVIESGVIEKVNYNMKVLEYYKQIFDVVPYIIWKRFLPYLPFNVHNYRYQVYYLRYEIRELFIQELVNEKQYVHKKFVETYDTILEHIQKRRYFGSTEIVDNVFVTLISIYESILKLYRNKENNAIYKDYIKDLSLNKRIELHEPMNIKKQLPPDLQTYKIRLNKYANAVPPANSSDERKLKEFNEKKSSNERKLKEFEEKMKEEYEEKMKEYNLKKEKDDKFKKEIYEGTYSPKRRLLSLKAYKKQQKEEPLLQVSRRKAKSESIRIHRSYSDKVKALKQKVEGSQAEMNELPDDYYQNDIDPYTQEAFSDMSPKKLKYLSDILYIDDGKRVFHYRFDTVTIYNYILTCIDNCDKPINFFNRTELTDANLKEICTKIKHFTKKPTYSYTELEDLFAKCDESKHHNRYNNCLRFEADVLRREGKLNLYLWIKLGNISFRVTSKKVLTLPLFINDHGDILDDEYGNQYAPDMNRSITDKVLFEILYKLKLGVLTSNRFFPYRKNKPILFNLPQFAFKVTDNKEKTLERLERYKKRIEQI